MSIRQWPLTVLRGEDGTSLIELVVGMAVMTVFMGMFTTAMLMMMRTTNSVQVVADTTNQATDAYLRLDREVRYAAAISTPGFDSASQTWHVEFLTNPSTPGGSAQCTQLAVAPPGSAPSATGTLKQRTWSVNATSPGGWNVLASSVTNYTSSSTPFPTTSSIAGAQVTSQMQQLTISLVTAAASTPTTQTTSTYTFTAVNSSTASTTNSTVCQQFGVGS